ncbi:hypothetical protein QBC39DRAFT_326288 [Podospora conica]|nr:hypothetical protein QBC39DRAFT_326288 [Schizothecium conicum]
MRRLSVLLEGSSGEAESLEPRPSSVLAVDDEAGGISMDPLDPSGFGSALLDNSSLAGTFKLGESMVGRGGGTVGRDGTRRHARHFSLVSLAIALAVWSKNFKFPSADTPEIMSNQKETSVASTVGRNALIIGAKQGIGLNLARKLHEKGWEVSGTVRSLADEANLKEVDTRHEDTIEAAAAAWGERPLDLLVISAGVGPSPVDMWEHTADILVEKFRVNTVGPYLVVKHFRSALKRSDAGKIITISSNMASLSNLQGNQRGGSIAYRMSKTALNQLTVSLSRTFAFEKSKVTVHAIHPGWIPTAMSSFTGPDDMDTQISSMVETIEKLGPEDSGRFMKVDGQDFPW